MNEEIDSDGEPAPEANIFFWLVAAIAITVLASIVWWLR